MGPKQSFQKKGKSGIDAETMFDCMFECLHAYRTEFNSNISWSMFPESAATLTLVQVMTGSNRIALEQQTGGVSVLHASAV